MLRIENRDKYKLSKDDMVKLNVNNPIDIKRAVDTINGFKKASL
jgi:hypothetical protein